MSETSIKGIIIPRCDLVLSGKIDRFEFVDNSDSRVRVIDFKTGNPKSRNEILGQTKKSDGNYYRQLQFYALLLRYFEDGAYYLEETVIHFVEQNKSGVYKEESFVIPSKEVDELEETIRRVERELRSGQYWDHVPTDPDACHFIDFVKRIKGIEG